MALVYSAAEEQPVEYNAYSEFFYYFPAPAAHVEHQSGRNHSLRSTALLYRD